MTLECGNGSQIIDQTALNVDCDYNAQQIPLVSSILYTADLSLSYSD